MFNGIQVRKTGDDTDIKIDLRGAVRNRLNVYDGDLPDIVNNWNPQIFLKETPPQSFNQTLNMSLDSYFYQLNNFKETEVPCLFKVGLLCLINKDSDIFL